MLERIRAVGFLCLALLLQLALHAAPLRTAPSLDPTRRIVIGEGETLVIPRGIWKTGSIELKSNATLHLEEGAELDFVDDLNAHLPAVRSTYEGIECMGYSSHVYAYGATNIAITGKGTLKTLRPSYSWDFFKAHRNDPDFAQAGKAGEQLRRWGADGVPVERRLYAENRGPRARMNFIHFGRCRGIRLEDFRIDGSPMWTVHLYRSSDIVARGLDIRARGLNTDGFDIEMSRNVLVENCTLDQQDDGFTIKAGKDAAGRMIGEPTENVLIRNCRVKQAHGILVIGSEVSAGVRNVRLENCTADIVGNGFYIKTNPYRGGYVEDVWFENVTCSNAQKAAFSIETDVTYGQKPLPGTEECLTRIRNIHVRNAEFFKATHRMKLTGDARRPIENVTVDGLSVGYVRRKETNVVENVRGLLVDGQPVGLSPRARRAVAPAPGRRVTELGGDGWTCDGLPCSVPHTWNAIDGSDGFPDGKMKVDCGSSVMSDSYLRKRGVYRRRLPNPTLGKRQFLRFDGASMKAEVKVNGKNVGGHAGAFTGFTLEITGAMKSEGNELEVAVDNRIDETVGPLNADFTMCGGLYRTVRLIETDVVCIDPTWYGTDGVILRADPKTGHVRAEVKVSRGAGEPSAWETQEFDFPRPRLWSPEEPNLYEIEIVVSERGGRDAIRRTVGFRTAEFRDGLFYLNGKKTKVHGVNRHEDYEGRGWALRPGDDALDARWMKAMGATAVRLAHGAHGQGIVDETDRQGLMAFVAIPFVNELRDTPEYRANARRETLETIAQFRNHPSVIWWDLYNEIYNSMKEIPEGFQEDILEEMRDLVKKTDPDRTVLGTTSIPRYRRLNAIPEQLCFNTYPMWYGKEKMGHYLDDVMKQNGRKTIALSEYGAGGSVYHHANPYVKCKPLSDFHAEEYQTSVHIEDWREIARRDDVWGSFIWNMFDFAADTRKEGDRLGINDKGLVTRDRAVAKDAFFFYKANWNPEPMLHLDGKRCRKAGGEAVTVRAFSNLGKPVGLFVNGERRGERMPDEIRVVRWDGVKLREGTNVVEVKCGAFTDRWEVEAPVKVIPQSLRAPESVRKANYDESKIAPYALENPLDYTREQILDIFAKNMYGEEPAKPKAGECTWKLRHEAVDLAGYAIRRNYRMTFRGNGRTHDLWWSLFLPRHAQRRCPLVMLLNYNGSDELFYGLSASPTNRCCFSVGTILARGYAVLTARYTDVSPDIQNDDRENYESGIFTVWPKRDTNRLDNVTSLGAWAWALSRGLDLAETIPEIDAKKTVVTGYSRLGKAALLAAVRDERFAVCVPVQTGGGGTPLAKRDFGENVARETWRFPHWFCRAYDRFAEAPEKTLFFDQHLLLASIAPRALLVEGYNGHWFDARGEYLSVRAASAMWEKRYRLPGLPEGGFPDNYDTSLIGPYLGYVRRTEDHGYAPIDWKWTLDFADGVFAKTESAPLIRDWQPQIDAAAEKGGGEVAIPGGLWSSKPLRLRSNVALRLGEGAQLVSADPNARDFISLVGVTNVAIRGEGEIRGSLAVGNCTNVVLRDFRLRDPVHGKLVLDRCGDVLVQQLVIERKDAATGGNGVESVGSDNVTVRDCCVRTF